MLSMKKMLVILALMVFMMSCLFGKTLVVASGEERDSGFSRYYTTIRIEEGDSLWTIAETYRKNSGMEIREYLYELKKINGLVSDRIMAGESLTVMYFAKEPLL